MIPRIQITLPFSELNVSPPLANVLTLADGLQQVLSLLSAYDGNERRLLRCSEGGILRTTTGLVQPTINIALTVADTNYVAAAHPCCLAIIKAAAGNSDIVYVNFKTTAVKAASFPLSAGENVTVGLRNTGEINVISGTNTQIVYIAYEV